MKEFVFGIMIGFSLGAFCMWLWFISNGLIRSRSEWYALRKAQGKKVPDYWQEDY